MEAFHSLKTSKSGIFARDCWAVEIRPPPQEGSASSFTHLMHRPKVLHSLIVQSTHYILMLMVSSYLTHKPSYEHPTSLTKFLLFS